MLRSAPIAVFDSGVGGLSVLRHIRALMPAEDVIYFADSAFSPYGEKTEEFIVIRTLAIADFLLQHQIKALVVACNTATAAAITALRARHPQLIVVGVEPGLKPAAALSKTGVVGVLATEATLNSAKFQALEQQLTQATGVRFVVQACNGLADQIEKGELNSPATARLVQRYVAPLLKQDADTIVLGCTHYPFVRHWIEQASAGREMSLIDTGAAVALQLQRLLQQQDLEQTERLRSAELRAFSSGSQSGLATAFRNLLGLAPEIQSVSMQTPNH